VTWLVSLMTDPGVSPKRYEEITERTGAGWQS
jgi:hypothetical protein